MHMNKLYAKKPMHNNGIIDWLCVIDITHLWKKQGYLCLLFASCVLLSAALAESLHRELCFSFEDDNEVW